MTAIDLQSASTLRLAIVSEWTKFRSVRSTIWSLGATAAFTIGLGLLFCWAFLHRHAGATADQTVFDPTAHSLNGLFLAQLSMGVLGVLVISSEYTVGMIRTTVAAVPDRNTLLAAKAIVVGVVALIVGMTTSAIAFVGGQAILHSQHLGASISDPNVLRAVLGAGFYLTLIALFGLAIGTIVRRTPGAIGALFGIVLVLPLLTEALPSPWNTDVGRLLPLNCGQAMLSVRTHPELLSAGTAFVVLLVWVAVSYVIAFTLLRARDV